MSQYLLSISIGPVQDFIATARRSRDLWFGSWLLSELSKAAANAIVVVHNDKERLIFPATGDPNALIPNSTFNVVNKILAVVDDPKAMGDAVLKAMKNRLREICEKPFDKIENDDANNYFLREIADNQVEDMIEFFWAAYPLDENHYGKSRENAELFLNARKATRDFKSSDSWASNAPKSALDGQRESVIHEDAFDNLNAKNLRRIYGVRSGERLCGVGLFKRNGNRGTEDSFFSTSHVAALPLIERLKGEHAVEKVAKYAKALCDALHVNDRELGRVPFKEPYKPHDVFSRYVDGEKIGYDGHILFAERLDDLIEDKSDKHKAKADLDNAREKLSKFLKDVLNDEKPLPYYALLLADGDNMGKAIDNIKDINRHRDFSKELSAFAKSVSAIVGKNHNGSLVYAGGDDVLAFVPLHTILQCARELANEFKKKLSGFAFTANDTDYQPTLSVGVVIAHHSEPLQDALTLVRKAEKAAKGVEGKEALAIILSKRSGVDTTIKGRWQRKDSRNALDHRLLRFSQLYLTDSIPDGAAYELRDLYLRLNCDKKKTEYEKLQEAMRDEAVRILKRKIQDGKILNELTGDIKNKETSIEDLANELIVAREFVKAFKQAGMKPEDLDEHIINANGREAKEV